MAPPADQQMSLKRYVPANVRNEKEKKTEDNKIQIFTDNIHILVLTASCRNNLGKPVPECQIILDLLQQQMNGRGRGGNRNSKKCKALSQVTATVSEMTYTVSSGMLNSTIPYHTTTNTPTLGCRACHPTNNVKADAFNIQLSFVHRLACANMSSAT